MLIKHGEKVKCLKHFDNLLSIGKTTKTWNLDNGTIRKAIAKSKLVNGIDIQKIWMSMGNN